MSQTDFYPFLHAPAFTVPRVIKQLLWAVTCLSLSLPPCFSQLDCNDLPCGASALRVEIILENDGHNVSTNCNNNNLACADGFYQLSYAVYLKYNNSDPGASLAGFNLAYHQLFVGLNLLKLSGNANQHSYIDVAATNKCFQTTGNGAGWYAFSSSGTYNGDKPIFSVDQNSVGIDFINNNGSACGTVPSGGGNNQIVFTYSTPAHAADCYGAPTHHCAYAKLFDVIVNVWPGESIQLEFDPKIKYVDSQNNVCAGTDFGIENENTGYNGLYAIGAINSPQSASGSENAHVELQLSGPTAGTNDHYFTVSIANTSSYTLSNNLIEFYIKVSFRNYTEPLTFGTHDPIDIIQSGADPTNSGYTVRLLHYAFNVTDIASLSSSSTVTLSTIHVPDPTLSNKNWSVLMSPQGGRLKTTHTVGGALIRDCTALGASGSGTYTVSTNLDECTDPSIVFDIVPVPSCVGNYSYNIGIRSTDDIQERWIRHFAFDLEFEMDSDVSIVNPPDFSNWDFTDCDNASSCAGTDDKCYLIDGNKFSYCYTVPSNYAPDFKLDPFRYINLSFSNSGGCVKSIKIRKLEIGYKCDGGCGADPSFCILPVDTDHIYIDPVTQKIALPLCGHKIYGNLHTAYQSDPNNSPNQGFNDATITLTTTSGGSCCTSTCTSTTISSNPNGDFGTCDVCTTCNHYTVMPMYDSNPLNGVSTYDLVLISRHILGIEALDSPYKIIAADANKNGSVTTFDIVEIRKLILGIYSTFPSNTSWRFVDASYYFPDNTNPFAHPFPETRTECISSPTALDFIAIKTGDVNGTSIPNRPAPRPVVTIGWNNTGAKPGSMITIPVIYTGSEALEAIQLGIHFDPSKLSLISPSKGDIPGYTADNFGLTHLDQGEIRTLWFPFTDEFEKIKNGNTLFYLTFKVLNGFSDAESFIQLDDNILANAAWRPDGTECTVLATPAAEYRKSDSSEGIASLKAGIRPNPATGAVTFTVTAEQSIKGHIALYGAFGNAILVRDAVFEKGEQEIIVSEIEHLPSGVYFWRVYGDGKQSQGHLVKE